MKSARLALLPLLFLPTAVPLLAAAPVAETPPSSAKKDPAKAQGSAEITSLRAKAERGNAIAQYNLGLAYVQGGQLPVDLPEAFVWLTLAAESGSTGRALETLLGSMNVTDMAEGRRRLEALRKTNPYLKPPVSSSPLPTTAKASGGVGTSKNTAAIPPTATASGTAPPVENSRGVGVTPGGAQTGEAKQLYDQLAAVSDEKRQLATELAAAGSR